MRFGTVSLVIATLVMLPACKTAPKKEPVQVVEEEEEKPEVVLPDGVTGLDINGDGKSNAITTYENDSVGNRIKAIVDSDGNEKPNYFLEYDYSCWASS